MSSSKGTVGGISEGLALGNCRSVGDFKKVNRIGEGTYGYVYRAYNRETKEVVALKRIILHNEKQDGFPLTSLREVKTLNACRNHPNIVRLHEVVVGSQRDAVFLLFEYCEHDLSTLMRAFKNPFKESEVKCLAKQLLSAVEYMHNNWIVHRDIKLSNLLYNSKGQLKLADFGLARTLSYPPPQALTQTVVTLWYRAPEVLLGATSYSFPIDIWSVGCILGELLLNQPLLPGNSELDQVKWIFHLLGCPSSRIWPEVEQMPLVLNGSVNLAREQGKYQYNTLRDTFPRLHDLGIELLHALLTYNPALRITARTALRHEYFYCSPYPQEADYMPTFPSQHDEMMKQSADAQAAHTVKSAPI